MSLTPGEPTRCECGHLLRWVEKAYPSLSTWEPCPLHLAAPELLAHAKTYIALMGTTDPEGIQDRDKELCRLKAAIAKAEGR